MDFSRPQPFHPVSLQKKWFLGCFHEDHSWSIFFALWKGQLGIEAASYRARYWTSDLRNWQTSHHILKAFLAFQSFSCPSHRLILLIFSTWIPCLEYPVCLLILRWEWNSYSACNAQVWLVQTCCKSGFHSITLNTCHFSLYTQFFLFQFSNAAYTFSVFSGCVLIKRCNYIWSL